MYSCTEIIIKNNFPTRISYFLIIRKNLVKYFIKLYHLIIPCKIHVFFSNPIIYNYFCNLYIHSVDSHISYVVTHFFENIKNYSRKRFYSLPRLMAELPFSLTTFRHSPTIFFFRNLLLCTFFFFCLILSILNH